MLNLFLLSFSFWLKMGQGLPLTIDSPLDYSFKTGFQGNHLFIEWQNGMKEGISIRGREHKYVNDIKKFTYNKNAIGEIRIGGHDFSRTSSIHIRDIDYQEINTVFSSEVYHLRAEAGVAYLWENFKKPSPCMKVGIEYDNFIKIVGSQVSNFDDRCFMDLYIGKELIFPVRIPGLYFSWENSLKYLWSGEIIKCYELNSELKVEFDFEKIWKKVDDNKKPEKDHPKDIWDID